MGWENVGERSESGRKLAKTPEERELKKSDGQCLESVLLVDVKMVDHVILVSDFKGFHDEKAWNAFRMTSRSEKAPWRTTICHRLWSKFLQRWQRVSHINSSSTIRSVNNESIIPEYFQCFGLENERSCCFERQRTRTNASSWLSVDTAAEL